MHVADEAESTTGPRFRWLYATVLVCSVFFVGMAAVSFAVIGPCVATNPISLVLGIVTSVIAIWLAFRLLNEQQRRFRLRTIPFYIAVLVAVLVILMQALFLFAS
jgi:NO-binding membrane sensor protein with MHYT domain